MDDSIKLHEKTGYIHGTVMALYILLTEMRDTAISEEIWKASGLTLNDLQEAKCTPEDIDLIKRKLLIK